MKQLLLCVVLVFSSIISAQPNANKDLRDGEITGRILDAQLNEPLPYVNVIVNDANKKLITGSITAEDGTFEIKKIPEGQVEVSIQYIGYKTVTKNIDIGKGNYKVNLGDILLEEDAESLDEVTVVAEVSTIQQKVDRKVINIGKDLVTAGPTAADIMNNLPSVNLNQQTGALSLRGNENVNVMVDGKLTNVPVDQLLRQIPTNSIKSIELITNPSAKYNPEGMSGIINIVLHKNTILGFNTNINLGYTIQDRAKYNAGVDMNYRNGKVNLYGSWGGNWSDNINFGNIDSDPRAIYQNFYFTDNNNSNLLKLGVDFYINEKNTLSIFTNQNIYNGGNEGMTTINDNGLAQNQFFNNIRDNNSQQYNLNYKLDFAKEGHNIELEADFNSFEDNEDALFRFVNLGQADYRDIIPTERDRTTINLDYTNPISETSKIELGAQARLFNSQIGRNSTQQVTNPFDITQSITTPLTNFDYARDIYSLYANYSKQVDKWSFQLGARFETVDVVALSTEQYAPGIATDNFSNLGTDPALAITRNGDVISKRFTNDYTQLYPSVFITFAPSEKNQFGLSYSRRVDRPGVGQVNPIREWSTPLITSFGSPSLTPQFTNSFEFNYTRSLEKGSITGGVFYRAIEDQLNRAVFIDRLDPDLNRLILTFDNFDNTFSTGVELSGNYKPTDWWSFNTSFDLFYQEQESFSEIKIPETSNNINDISTEVFKVDNVAWNFRMFNNFKVSKALSFSAFGFYRGENRGVQFAMKPMYFVNIGARYTFWKQMATLSVNYNDIFNTQKFIFEGDRPFEQNGEFNWESNTINVALSIRLGSNKYRAKSRKRRDNDEKSGGGGFL